MKNYNVLSVILLAMALSNCGGTKKEKILYLISILHHFGKIHPEEVLNLEILNLESKSR
jgi:hypothetical protein